ncbi:MAG: carbon storage regulator CsrA [Desulfurispora sp.]|uniref:carbon storage regulator CsrA n=1 Tax=Desulfurispora sp. TaxID=3014275 RepID=UPI00404A61DE
MLVLSRKKNQTIYIGADIQLTVVEISGDTVKLGITAPRQIDIVRAEVRDAVSRENRQAAGRDDSARQLLDMLNRHASRPDIPGASDKRHPPETD